MKLGFSTMNTPEDVRPAILARELEDRGFDSLFIGEHSHIPASRLTPYPSGGEMPDPYRRMMDPFVALMAAAGATTRLRIATGVCLCLEHHILDLAKSVATLDVLSGGRVLFGVGVGWNEEELANHRPDIAWRQRYRALAECIAALKILWTEENAEFHGEFFDFDPVWSFPKPVQAPHPPIMCGTGGRLGTTHAVQWADQWAPMDIALGNVGKKISKFREAADAAGRGDIPITIVAFGDPTMHTLELYKGYGVESVIVGAARQGWGDPSTTMPFIDRYTPFVDQLA
jgi:probable F420-dependent oxidoreductase